jgi:putative hydrolase of the HAD superfamily
MGDEVSAVLFDADGVVQHRGEGLADLASAQGWNAAELDAFLADVFSVQGIHAVALDELGGLLDGVAARHRLRGAPEQFLREWCRAGIAPDEAAFETVRRLRHGGVICALATNQSRFRAEHMRSVLGYGREFDRLFVSCDLGVAKPDPKFFQAALDDLGLQPSAVLFIDDHPANVDAASSLGLQAVLFTPGESLDDAVGAFGL